MTHDKHIDDSRLKQLIAESFAATPEPDREQLELIRRQLVTTRKVRHSLWWLAPLLIAGSVAAGWSIYKMVTQSSPVAIQGSTINPATEERLPATGITIQRNKSNDNNQQHENSRGQQRPIIYLR
jgi:hypothetical protein